MISPGIGEDSKTVWNHHLGTGGIHCDFCCTCFCHQLKKKCILLWDEGATKKDFNWKLHLVPIVPNYAKKKMNMSPINSPPKKKMWLSHFSTDRHFFRAIIAKTFTHKAVTREDAGKKMGERSQLNCDQGWVVGMFKKKLLQTSKKQNVKKAAAGVFRDYGMKFIGFMPSTFTLVIEIVQPKKLFTLPHSFFSAVYVSACHIFNASHHELFT